MTITEEKDIKFTKVIVGHLDGSPVKRGSSSTIRFALCPF
uniref:Uncharacterized protein n=1 Tax=Parascaris equorum TaxID=6256 RepID=A0A914S4R2_PAREQ